MATRNAIAIYVPIEDSMYRESINEKRWFHAYPEFHSTRGLYKISLKSEKSIENTLWTMLQKKYGEKDIAGSRGPIISNGVSTYHTSDRYAVDQFYDLINAHQNTDVIWSCGSREVRVRSTDFFHERLYNNQSEEDVLNKLTQENTNSKFWPGGGIFAITYINKIIAEDYQQTSHKREIKNKKIEDMKYEQKINSAKNQL